MGWNTGGEVFDPIGELLIKLKLSDEQKTTILSKLIEVLQDRDWDTEGESLAKFQDHPAIVEAFRQNSVFIICEHEDTTGDWCELERGHPGDHMDYDGNEWANDSAH